MGRYFINLRLRGEFISDEQGVDCPSDEAACRIVWSSVTEMVAHDIMKGLTLSEALDGITELKDEIGRPVLFATFLEIVHGNCINKNLDLINIIERRASIFGHQTNDS